MILLQALSFSSAYSNNDTCFIPQNRMMMKKLLADAFPTFFSPSAVFNWVHSRIFLQRWIESGIHLRNAKSCRTSTSEKFLKGRGRRVALSQPLPFAVPSASKDSLLKVTSPTLKWRDEGRVNGVSIPVRIHLKSYYPLPSVDI